MNKKELKRKLLYLLRPYMGSLVVIMICLFLSVGLNFLTPVLGREAMDKGLLGQDQRVLFLSVISIFFCYITNAFIDLVKEKRRIDIAGSIQYRLTEQSYKHLMKLKIKYFNDKKYSDILNNVNSDIRQITSIVDENLFFIISQIFCIVGSLLGLMYIDFSLGLFVLFFIPIKYFVMRYFTKKGKKNMGNYIEANRDYTKWFRDSIGGIREIRLFGMMMQKDLEFTKKQKEVVECQKEWNLVDKWNMIFDSVLVQFLIMIIFLMGANMFFRSQITVGGLIVFVTYITYITTPVSAIFNIGYLISDIVPSTKRYLEFMNLEEENNIGAVEPEFGELEFENISFIQSDKTLLNHVSFTIQKYCKTAFIGMNNSGDTLIDLILRLSEPNEGKIWLDKKDITQYSINTYREMIAVISPHIYLFNDTIKNNICFYKGINEEKVMEALKDSGLENFILENTLNYKVGENGAMLTGKQKQRVALARAIVHNTPIIIFDGTESSSEFYSELKASGFLEKKLRDRTIIVVTFKKEVLSQMDRIVLLKDGAVNGCGSYEELCRDNEEFAGMVQMESSMV